MRYIKTMGLCLVAALACCVSVTASASAESSGGPSYGFCDEVAAGTGHYTDAHCETRATGNWEAKLLLTGEHLTVLASAKGKQLLKSAAGTVECEALKLKPGAIVTGGLPGGDLETIQYSQCSVIKSKSTINCDASTVGGPNNGTISTNPLESELVYLSEEDAKKLWPDESGTLFKPAAGGNGKFVEIELTPLGTGTCPVLGENNGPAKLPVAGEALLRNESPLVHKLSGVLVAPETALRKWFLGTSGVEMVTKKLELGGVEAKYIGEVSIALQLLGSERALDWWLCP